MKQNKKIHTSKSDLYNFTLATPPQSLVNAVVVVSHPKIVCYKLYVVM